MMEPIEAGMLNFIAEGLKQRSGSASRIIMPGTLGSLIDRDPRYRDLIKSRTLEQNPCTDGPPVDVLTFAEDPNYLGLKLFPKQKEILYRFNHELEETIDERGGLVTRNKWKEFVAMVGMRSGKTVVASIQESYELYCLLMLKNPQEHYGLVPGQEIYLINVAASETQSKDTVFAQLQARIDNSPWFKRYISYLKSFGRVRKGDFLFRNIESRIEFHDKHIICMSMNSNSLTNVGKTSKFVVFDELAKFKTAEGKDSADEVYSSISRATQTFGWNGHVWSISSPLNDMDKIVELSETARKGEVRGMLGMVLPTWEFNPNIKRSDLDREYIKDPVLADRDFGCVPPKSHQEFIHDPDSLKASIFASGLRPLLQATPIVKMKKNPRGEDKPYVQLVPDWELPFNRAHTYIGHGDPGLVDDSFCFGVGHLEIRQRKERNAVLNFPVVVMDILLEWKPDPAIGSQVDFLDVKETIKYIHSRIGLQYVSFDKWNSAHLIQELLDFGIMAEDLKFTDQGQFQQYMTLRRLAQVSQFESFDGDDRSWEQFKSLKIINGQRIDHPAKGKVTDKDRSDCWAAIAHYLTKDLLEEGMFLNAQESASGALVRQGGMAAPRTSRLGGVPAFVSDRGGSVNTFR
jgi:hypothetical protein